MGLATIAINMAMLDAKTRLLSRQRKESITKELPWEAVQIKAHSGGKGWQAVQWKQVIMERDSGRRALTRWRHRLGLRRCVGLERDTSAC